MHGSARHPRCGHLTTPPTPPPGALPQSAANVLLRRAREREILAEHSAEVGVIEQLLDVVPLPADVAARDADQLPPGAGGGRMLGPASRLSASERQQLRDVVLPRLFLGGEAEVCGGWTLAALQEAVVDGRAQAFCRATLGPGDGPMFSRRYGRQRTRDTCHVKVRWEEDSGAVPHICAVQCYVLLRAADRDNSGGNDNSGDNSSGTNSSGGAEGAGGSGGGSGTAAGLPPVRIALTKAHKATAVGTAAGRLWRTDASSPADGGTLWPVLLEQIDCKLLIASPGGNSAAGQLFGMEYTSLSRAV